MKILCKEFERKQEADDWNGPGRSIHLLLCARRKGRSGGRAETGDDETSDETSIQQNTA